MVTFWMSSDTQLGIYLHLVVVKCIYANANKVKLSICQLFVADWHWGLARKPRLIKMDFLHSAESHQTTVVLLLILLSTRLLRSCWADICSPGCLWSCFRFWFGCL